MTLGLIYFNWWYISMVTYTTIVEIIITDRLLQSQKSALNRTMSVLHKMP